jgi:hypothetical protein
LWSRQITLSGHDRLACERAASTRKHESLHSSPDPCEAVTARCRPRGKPCGLWDGVARGILRAHPRPALRPRAGGIAGQPVRKALLAGSLTPETDGRAFGFERMRDAPGGNRRPGDGAAVTAAGRASVSDVVRADVDSRSAGGGGDHVSRAGAGAEARAARFSGRVRRRFRADLKRPVCRSHSVQPDRYWLRSSASASA